MDKQDFPNTGLVRLSSIIAPTGPIPVSKSAWWQGVKDGRFPKPLKLGPRTTVWRVEEIRALFEDKVARGAYRSLTSTARLHAHTAIDAVRTLVSGKDISGMGGFVPTT